MPSRKFCCKQRSFHWSVQSKGIWPFLDQVGFQSAGLDLQKKAATSKPQSHGPHAWHREEQGKGSAGLPSPRVGTWIHQYQAQHCAVFARLCISAPRNHWALSPAPLCSAAGLAFPWGSQGKQSLLLQGGICSGEATGAECCRLPWSTAWGTLLFKWWGVKHQGVSCCHTAPPAQQGWLCRIKGSKTPGP